MSPFAEVRIDDNLIIYHTVGGPLFSTDIVPVDSGDEYRNARWSLPLGQWELGERSMMPADFAVMKSFFNARKGQAQGFRFKDWADYRDEGGGIIVEVPVPPTSTQFEQFSSGPVLQLYKSYTSGGETSMRKISKPVAGIKIYNDGMLDSGATVDLTSGIVVPSSSIGTLTWTGEFDTPVRFAVDQLKTEFIGVTGAGGAANVKDVYLHLLSLPIVEIRP
jgi:uncharacterized protein (TIGR02217 family)